MHNFDIKYMEIKAFYIAPETETVMISAERTIMSTQGNSGKGEDMVVKNEDW